MDLVDFERTTSSMQFPFIGLDSKCKTPGDLLRTLWYLYG